MSSSHGSHGTGHRGRRLRQFLRPDGRRVHVAHSPEEAAKLKKHLESSDEPFDVYIHGSPEHLEALREVHGHHERRRDELRQQHGDVYEEFEKVRLELDSLSSELRMITEMGVALDANFSKYGYSAHLRTRADHQDSSASSTLSGDTPSESHDWKAEKHNGYALKFYKRPVVRQYFHKGLLWRAPESEEVASFELFVDLLYVGIIAVNGEDAAHHPDGKSLLWFTISFILSWKIWSDLTLTISWFETDDIVQRLSVLFTLACLFGYTINIVEADHGTYTQLIAFFLAARLFGGAYLTWLTFVVPMIRPILIGNIIAILVAAALWIGSIHTEDPHRQALIWCAIVVDLFGGLALLFLHRGSKHISKSFGERMANLFEFIPAVNIEHKTERTNAFVSLVFGHSVLSLIYQNRSSMGVNVFYGKAVLGLIQAFAFNWMYFEVDGINLYRHAIRRKVWSAILWTIAHLPFVLAYVLGAAGMQQLVLAHDFPEADEHTLSEEYVNRSAKYVSSGLRWFYCAGFGVALAFMSIISMSHLHKDVAGARLKKMHRMGIRLIVAVVLVCLPLAKSLNSLQLIGTVTGLVVFVLIVDIYGHTNVETAFFGGRRHCAYTADCPMKKKDLEHAVKSGETVTIQALAEKESGEKALFESS